MSWFTAAGKPAQRQKAKASIHTASHCYFTQVLASHVQLPYSFKQKVGMPYSKAAMDPVSIAKCRLKK